MYFEVAHDDWAQLLPFVQMVHNTVYPWDTARYHVWSHVNAPYWRYRGNASGRHDSALHYTRKAVENLQFAYQYELARQNLGERAKAQAASNADLRYQQFPPSDLELVQQPHNAQDYPNNICTSLARSIPDSPSFIAGCPPNIERWWFKWNVSAVR